MTSAANVSSYARAMAHTNHSLQRLFAKKNLADKVVFCLLWIVKPLFFVNLE